MLSPSDPKIRENLPKIREIIKNRNVLLYFIPSSKLRSAIAQGDNPILKKIPEARKIELLAGIAICIQKRMVWSWLNNTLDESNAFILSNGEVRVVDTKLTSHHNLIGKGD